MELIDGIGSKRVRYLLWGEPGRGLKGRRPESEAPGGGEETGDGKRPGGGEETGDEKRPGVGSDRGLQAAGDIGSGRGLWSGKPECFLRRAVVAWNLMV